MAEGQVVLAMAGVTKVYGSGDTAVTALADVSFEARAGELVLVMGPSGSGKTTLLAVAGALLKPTRGTVQVCGWDVSGMSEGRLAGIRRDKVAFVYQSFNLLEALTALENVRLVIGDKRGGRLATERAAEILRAFGLGHRLHSLPRKLSDGEKQRVAIARALAKDPAIILADEPTANLDARRGREVIELLRQRALDLEKAVVVVSHDHRILDVADRVLWLEDGRLHGEVETVRDPVCGTVLETGAALSTLYLEGTYYFCTERCLKAFERDPLRYLGIAEEEAGSA